MNIYIAFLLALADGSLACISFELNVFKSSTTHNATATPAMERAPEVTWTTAEQQEVTKGIGAFAVSLLEDLPLGEGNAVVSPLRAAAVLALLRMGTVGETAEQISAALSLPQDPERVRRGYRALLAALARPQDNSNDALLRMADRLYLQRGLDIEDSFNETAVEDFMSNVEEINFTDSNNARYAINQWVEDYTNDKITNFIPQDLLPADSQLVLVNAIYFSAQWQNPFRKQNTQTEPFHVSSSQQVNVSMMHGDFQLSYADVPQLKATVVKLPFQGSNLQAEMVFMLPDWLDDLGYLESNLGEFNICSIEFEQRQVAVTIPKFRIETTLQLKNILQQIGIRQIFNTTADLSGISKSSLYVNDLIQKSFINVNENGTEAPAATGVGDEVADLKPASFEANHPFLFVVRAEGTILFVGRVENPSMSELQVFKSNTNV